MQQVIEAFLDILLGGITETDYFTIFFGIMIVGAIFRLFGALLMPRRGGYLD